MLRVNFLLYYASVLFIVSSATHSGGTAQDPSEAIKHQFKDFKDEAKKSISGINTSIKSLNEKIKTIEKNFNQNKGLITQTTNNLNTKIDNINKKNQVDLKNLQNSIKNSQNNGIKQQLQEQNQLIQQLGNITNQQTQQITELAKAVVSMQQNIQNQEQKTQELINQQQQIQSKKKSDTQATDIANQMFNNLNVSSIQPLTNNNIADTLNIQNNLHNNDASTVSKENPTIAQTLFFQTQGQKDSHSDQKIKWSNELQMHVFTNAKQNVYFDAIQLFKDEATPEDKIIIEAIKKIAQIPESTFGDFVIFKNSQEQQEQQEQNNTKHSALLPTSFPLINDINTLSPSIIPSIYTMHSYNNHPVEKELDLSIISRINKYILNNSQNTTNYHNSSANSRGNLGNNNDQHGNTLFNSVNLIGKDTKDTPSIHSITDNISSKNTDQTNNKFVSILNPQVLDANKNQNVSIQQNNNLENTSSTGNVSNMMINTPMNWNNTLQQPQQNMNSKEENNTINVIDCKSGETISKTLDELKPMDIYINVGRNIEKEIKSQYKQKRLKLQTIKL